MVSPVKVELGSDPTESLGIEVDPLAPELGPSAIKLPRKAVPGIDGGENGSGRLTIADARNLDLCSRRLPLEQVLMKCRVGQARRDKDERVGGKSSRRERSNILEKKPACLRSQSLSDASPCSRRAREGVWQPERSPEY